MILGYPIPGSHKGRAFTLPDSCHGLVDEEDARRVADELRRNLGREPNVQTVRGAMIRMVKEKRK